ncbi:hypothetical protein FIV42_15765 [Persicimonas caeni]|uniref:Uncharacterized protein n=1 Tax=Persicimonas caeni TaxID=2292766 RepID=A0A4Y6PUY2_PERCE|nr:hypothetical protein [Persicimonas caeni]QDG52146.1 hypothetical protein FIV42_15765 [Persicimonas caeni]QED33368.1 hypothetical protein FRD00_15760 [Persicimonas caeni]
MSEYRYYEFRTIDRPLSDEQMRELRGISTRAEITQTSFINEYNWGDLKARPERLVEDYFDAYLHITNYGLREVMLRVPLGALDLHMAAEYQTDECLSIWSTETHHVVKFAPYLEDLGYEDWWEDQRLLSSITPLRDELARGDLRALYLGWLFAAVYGWLEPDEPEPPLPAGLDRLTGPLSALAQFICLDEDHLLAAAEASPEPAPEPSNDELRSWLGNKTEAQKIDWLMKVVRGEDHTLGAYLRREFATEHDRLLAGRVAETGSPRTAGALYERAEQLYQERRAREQEKKRREEERKRQEQQRNRDAYLDQIEGQDEGLWAEVEQLVESYKPRDYDAAVEILLDLHDLAERKDNSAAFERRLADFKERYGRRRRLMERLEKKDL